MKIRTKYHDKMEVKQQDIWHFPAGIPGFLEEKEFVLYPLVENDIFSILQSVTNEGIAFIVTNPFVFFKEYDFVLEEQIVSALEIKDVKDVVTLAILTLGDSLESTTANLQAPIIFNTQNHHAKQVILHETSYQTKHSLKANVEQG